MRKFLMLVLAVFCLTVLAVAEDPFEGLELKIAYDFDFWDEDDISYGTKDDRDLFFSDSQAGVSVLFSGTRESAFKDEGKKDGLAFRHESIWEAGATKNYVAFSLEQRHDFNMYAYDEFPDAKYFTIYIDLSNYSKNFEFYPIIYEQDYNEDGSKAGVSCLAVKGGVKFYLKSLEGELTTGKTLENWVKIPKGFVGRIYMPLDDYVPIWGTADVNGKFDGLEVIRYKFSLVDIGNKGEYVLFDEFGFLL
ncbi:MAG: hypothetical protein PHD88_08775 [Firmicutes bacterium]|nr:hypothetical protein [Bacillota bacterium]MDD4694471.1 hypothetical protein [Bacillota bacterium]